jgi:putative ABC transport system permease protein
MNFLLLGKDSAERVNTAVVSANFFDVLGVRPLLGRTFVASDESHGADAVLVLSYEYWKGRHGGDPNIVGKVFQMNNRPHTVIGVLPSIPQYPVENDVYMPTSQCPYRSSAGFIADRTSRMMTAFGRIKPGVPLQQAQATSRRLPVNSRVLIRMLIQRVLATQSRWRRFRRISRGERELRFSSYWARPVWFF